MSASSDGFCPGRSAPQAVAQAQRYLGEGYGWVVDLDLEKFCDRVKERVADRRVVQLIDRDLKAGALTDAGLEAAVEGTPPGHRHEAKQVTACMVKTNSHLPVG